MKIRNFMVLLFAVILCIFSGCGKSSELDSLSAQCGIDLSGGSIESQIDTHGGFLGDGCKQVVVRCSDGLDTEKMETGEHWHRLPLTDNLCRFLYEPYYDGLEIPKVDNGFYYFQDRHSQSSNPDDDSELFKRYSYNFTLVIFDTDTNKLYYLKFDT